MSLDNLKIEAPSNKLSQVDQTTAIEALRNGKPVEFQDITLSPESFRNALKNIADGTYNPLTVAKRAFAQAIGKDPENEAFSMASENARIVADKKPKTQPANQTPKAPNDFQKGIETLTPGGRDAQIKKALEE